MVKKNKKRKGTKRRAKPKNKKARATNALNKAWGKISSAAGGVVTLQLITGTDMAASTGQPMATRAKNFVNSLLGRTTGYAPFAGQSHTGGQIPQTLSIEGMFNKYTAIALGLIGYSMIPAKILPHRAKAKSLGKKIFGGALLGGLFKSSTNPHNTNLLTTQVTPSIPNFSGVT